MNASGSQFRWLVGLDALAGLLLGNGSLYRHFVSRCLNLALAA